MDTNCPVVSGCSRRRVLLCLVDLHALTLSQDVSVSENLTRCQNVGSRPPLRSVSLAWWWKATYTLLKGPLLLSLGWIKTNGGSKAMR